MKKYEHSLEKYIYSCLDNMRGYLRSEGSYELLLAFHMLREIAHRSQSAIFDFNELPDDKTHNRLSDFQQVLTTFEGIEFTALASKLNAFSTDPKLLSRVIDISQHKDWDYIVPETELSLNQTLINKLLVKLLESKGSKQHLGVLSDYVCEIVSNILQEYDVNEVYDPCAGSSKLALYSAENLNSKSRENNYKRVVVNEINSSAVFLSFARFLGSNITDFEIRQSDALIEEVLSPKRHEAAVLFPPIKMDASDYEPLFSNFPFFIKRDAATLFIDSALELTNPNGVVIAILPESFLFGQNKAAQYRNHLVQSGVIRCAIKLPKNCLSNAGINLSLIVLDKNHRSEHVRLIDASENTFQSNSKVENSLLPTDIAALAMGTDNKYNENICTDISISRIVNNDAILSFNYYKQFALNDELNNFKLEFKLAELEIHSLMDICNVEFGKNISKDKINDRQITNSIPFLKVGDIKGVDKIYSKSFVELNTISQMIKLIAFGNSIVFSIQGTVGKTAMVPSGKSYFPSTGISVLGVTSKLVLPEYLVAYLTSKPIREWLEIVSSSSATIRRIDKKQLMQLPVLVPPLKLQHLLVKEFNENKTDLFDSIKLLTNDLSKNEFIYPLQKISKSVSGFLSDKKFSIVAYLEFFSHISSLKQYLGAFDYDKHADYEVAQLSLINELKGILEVLNNLQFVPNGQQQSTILNMTFESLAKLKNKLEDALYFSSLISDICNGIQLAIKNFMDLQSTIGSLLIEISPRSQGEQGKIIATVKNSYRFPLINIQVLCDSLKEPKLISFIEDNAEKQIKLDFNGEVHSAILEWQAFSLDNTHYSGQVELSGLSTNSHDDTIEWKGSPYITGDPVKPNQEMTLYGRDEILKSISRYIAESGNVVLLEGNRRVGKSSILYHLQSNTFIPGWICVYMSLQECEGCDKSGIPAWSIWRVMTSQIILALVKSGLEVHLPDGEVVSLASGRFYQNKVKTAVKKIVSIESPFFDFQSYLEELLEALKSANTGIVIMIDEFDKLQEGIDNGVTTPQVPENIRSIIHRYDNLSAILTGSRRLQRLREEYWSALFGLGTRIGVSELDLVNSRKLIIEPSAGQLRFTEESVDQIVDQTGRHPFLIQCLCNKIYDSAAQANIRQIDTKFVSQAISDFIKDNEHFMYFWNLAGVAPGDSRCQLMLFIFAREEQSGNRLSSGELLESLIEKGIDLSEKLFEKFLNYLLELELIERRGVMGDQVYSLTTPLLSKWLLESQDYERVLASARQEFEKD